MKPNLKFVRVVLGAMLGAALWAGCTTDRSVAYEPAGASIDQDRAVRLDQQNDMTKWSPDTHPEWRTGWNMAFPNAPHGTVQPGQISTVVDQPILTPPQER